MGIKFRQRQNGTHPGTGTQASHRLSMAVEAFGGHMERNRRKTMTGSGKCSTFQFWLRLYIYSDGKGFLEMTYAWKFHHCIFRS